MVTSMAEATNEFCFLYSTFPDADSAHAAARAAVAQKLVACVNVYPPMTSFYLWQGTQEEAQEVAGFFKTRRALVPELMAALRAVHPYTTPCFLVLPIEAGNSDYLAWAREQTERAVVI